MTTDLHISPFTVATENNCTQTEHRFRIIERRKTKRVRHYYPDWSFGIWQCIHCDKIKTGT